MLRGFSTKIGRAGLGGLAVLGCAQLAVAGGFWLTLGNPAASSDLKAKNAFVVVRADGCHTPSMATITGTAEGLVNGRRQSVPLKLTPLSAPGAYAVHREWPAEGTWVVKLTGKYLALTTSTLVPVMPDGFRREMAKFFPHAPSEADVENALRAAIEQGGKMQARAK